MSFLGKLKTAIKGNPVLKEYEIGKQVASAGPGLLWKIYNATKKVNKQEVSVFIFYKQVPELEKVPKKEREALFEMLKRGPTHLARFRHPKILTIDHPVEESSDCIAFATEPVFASLANVLGYYDNLPSPLPLDIKEHQLHTVEVHYGLLQVSEALHFLHSDVKMMHGDLTLNSILISRHGDWKLAGFNFSIFIQYQSGEKNMYDFKEWNNIKKKFPMAPSLEYLAPEYVLSNSCNEHSDMYSYGMLSFAIYNGGKPLFECHNNTLTYKHNIELISRISESSLGDTPTELRPLVRNLLVTEPSVRPDALEVAKNSYFDDVLVRGLQYVDTLVEKTDMEKSQWFKNTLGRLITKYPKRVVHQRILPGLATEFRNHKMIPFVLPLVLVIADDCNVHEYNELVLPILIPAFKIYEPIQIPLIFLQKMDLLLKLTGPEQRKQYILPMILGAMEANSNQVQELCVSILPTFADMIDYTSMKHSIVPRITFMCIETNSNSLRIKCLLSVGQMLGTFDKGIVLDNILPTIYKIKSREPGVLMGILGIFHKTLTTQSLGLTKEYLACTALPYLIPLLMETKLNVSQFTQFTLLIKEMIKKIEVEQKAHLEQLAKMEEQTKSTVEFAKEVSEAKHEEDSIKAIESFGSGGSPKDVITAKVGSVRTSTYKTNDLFSGTSATSNLLSGIDLTSSSTSTPTLVNKGRSNEVKKINFSEPITPSQSLGTWEIPNTQTNTTSMGMSLSSNVLSPQNLSQGTSTSQTQSSSTAMSQTQSNSSSVRMGWSNNIMQPIPQTQSSSSSMGTGMMQPIPQTQSNSSSMGTGMMQPIPQTQSNFSSMGTGMMQPIPQTQSNSSSMGTGMGNIMQPTPQTQSNFSSMGTGMIQPIPQTQSSSSSMGTGMMQPIPQTQSNSSSMGTRMMQPIPQTQSNSSSMGTGMGNIMQPTPQTQSNFSSMGTGMMQPIPQTQSNSFSMGTGMGNIMQPTPQTQSNFSSMGTGMMQPIPQTQSNSSSMGTGMGNIMQPTPQTQSSSSSIRMGWSNNITQTQSSMGMGNAPKPQAQSSSSIRMGWSSNINLTPQTSSGTGWSSNIMQQTQSNPSMGMGVLQPTQAHSNPGMGMGILQPAQAHSSSSMGIMKPTQAQPAPGPNPFADIDSILS